MAKILWFLKKPPLPQFVPAEPRASADMKAFNADALINNPIYQEVIDRIEADCLAKWKTTAWDAKEMREQLYLHVKVLRQIDGFIKSYVTDVKHKEQQRQYKPE